MYGARASRDRFMIDQADFVLCLRLQHTHQIGILHGREWMILHATFIEQYITNEKIALENRTTRIRKSWRCNRELRA